MGVVVGGSVVAVRCAVSVGFWVGLGVGVKTGVFVGDDSKLIVRVTEGGMTSSFISVTVEDGERACGAVFLCISAHADMINGINKHIRTRFTGCFSLMIHTAKFWISV